MQSTISGDFWEGLRINLMAKFSDNVTSLTWRLITLVGVNVNCRADVGATLMICYHTAVRNQCTPSHIQTMAIMSHSPRLLCHDVTLPPRSEASIISKENGINRK